MYSTLLLLTGLVFISLSIYTATKKYNNLSKLSTIIYTIAGATYLMMSCLQMVGNETPIRVLRYIDWYITIPLLILQMSYFFSGQLKLIKLLYPIIFSLLMLTFGLFGELGFNNEWSIVKEGQLFDLRPDEFKIVCGMISTGLMSQLFISLSGNLDKSKIKLFTKIFILWIFYPLVYFIPESNLTMVLFSIADITTKYGIGTIMYNDYENKKS
jgi:bacteriorhodopsin